MDRYAAAHSIGDKPRASAMGQMYSKPSSMFVTPSKPILPKTSVSTVSAGRGGSHLGSPRRCFNCGFTEHLRATCTGVKKSSGSGHASIKQVGRSSRQTDVRRC